MPSFSLHPLLPSLRVRVVSLHQHGDRLYVGTATGSVQVYSFVLPQNGEGSSSRPLVPTVELIKTYSLGRKPIDQIGVLPESKQLAVLSDSAVTLYDTNFTKSSMTPLAQAKSAHCFAITSFTPAPSLSKKKSAPSLKAARSGADTANDVAKARDLLVVGCRKKVVVFGAGKSGLKDAWELPLPHSPRHIVIPSQTVPKTATSSLPDSIHLLYSPQSSALLNIVPSSSQRLSVTDLPLLPSSSASNTATEQGHAQEASGGGLTGALTGLGGYVGLGGKAAGPIGTSLENNESLIGRDEQGVFFSSEGSFSRTRVLQWPNPPDYIAFSSPFIYSAVATEGPSGVPASPVISVHLAPTLAQRNTLPLPLPSTGSATFAAATVTNSTGSAVAASHRAAPGLIVATTPTDKSLTAAEGSSISVILAEGTEQQVDDLVREGLLRDAVGLVEAVGEEGLPTPCCLPSLRTLRAVQMFAEGDYQAAIETFLRYDISPALVLSLYPSEAISGRLAVPKDKWMGLFGATEGARLQPVLSTVASAERPRPNKARVREPSGISQISKKGSIESLRKASEDDKQSSTNGAAPPVMTETELPRAALEALMYYLSDRRQKVTGAMAALPPSDPLPAESSLPALSSLSATELHALPSIPLTELDSEKLLRVAQIIYTALIKVYLVARPILVGSLCRIDNWCDVEEVEGLLKAQQKFGDLIDLYQGKKMHGKALKMLHELALKEDDKLDRYPPTIRYLEKLGPSELPLIFEHSEWIFKEEPAMALQIFTADEPEVEALPRQDVTAFLERISKVSCIGYLEHIINTLNEEGSDYHDKLAELYLDAARADLKAANGDAVQPDTYSRLLLFLESSPSIRPYRLLNKLVGDQMPEARAILLGKMGNHEEALRVYVYRLHDYTAAETFCSKVYSGDPNPHGIYLTLLNIYLRPAKAEADILLAPAIQLIASNGPRIDPQAVLDLLPPLVTMEDVRLFFVRTLRDGHAKKNERRVVKNLASARKEEVERVLMEMQMKRVRVRDQRICPQCQKRLGGSAIAVHAPRGEVTHLHCKDIFSASLARLRDV